MIKPFQEIVYKQEQPAFQTDESTEKSLLIIGISNEEPSGEYIEGQLSDSWLEMFLGQKTNQDKLYHYEPYVISNLKRAEKTFGLDSAVYSMIKDLYEITGNIEVSAMNIYLREDIENRKKDISFLMEILEKIDLDYILFDSRINIETDFLFFNEYCKLAILKENQGQLINAFSLTKELDVLTAEDTTFENIANLSLIDRDSDSNFGTHLSVILDQIGPIDAHIMYAGLCMIQKDSESPINKKLLEGVVLNHEISLEDEIEFNENGVVTLADSFHKGVIFKSSKTAVIGNKTHSIGFENFKIVSAVMKTLKNELETLIGTTRNRLFLSTKIHDVLEQVETYFIYKECIKEIDYNFSINEEFGTIFLNLYIYPIFTTKSIKVSTRIEVK